MLHRSIRLISCIPSTIEIFRSHRGIFSMNKFLTTATALFLLSATSAFAALPTQTFDIVFDGMSNQFYAKRPGTTISYAVQAMTEESAEYLADLKHTAAHAQRNTCHVRAQFVHSTAPVVNIFAISCENVRLTSTN